MKEKEVVRYPYYRCEKCGKVTTWDKNFRCSCGGRMNFKILEAPEWMAKKAHEIVEETSKIERGFSFY